MESTKPLIVIVGPTASGKSAAAMDIAKAFNGEIICADSRTIYKHLDIATAKPSAKDRATVPHWGLDLVEPAGVFTAHDFKLYAQRIIDDVKSRGRLPIMVGGTGLYIDAVLFDFVFRPKGDPQNRSLLESKTVLELQQLVQERKLVMPHNSQNKRHLIRVIEADGQSPQKSPMRSDAHVYGILPELEVHKQAISSRVDAMFTQGLLQEVTSLRQNYGQRVSEFGICYPFIMSYLDGQMTLAEAKAAFIQADWQYARRQRTWFKRHDFIYWTQSGSSCTQEITRFLRPAQ